MSCVQKEFVNPLVRIAGHDTLAIALRAILYYVARDSRVYRKLQVEIDEAVSGGRVLTCPASFSEASQLRYLYVTAP